MTRRSICLVFCFVLCLWRTGKVSKGFACNSLINLVILGCLNCTEMADHTGQETY